MRRPLERRAEHELLFCGPSSRLWVHSVGLELLRAPAVRAGLPRAPFHPHRIAPPRASRLGTPVVKGPPSNKRLKLAARFFRGMIAFVRPYSSISALGCGAPGRAGRRSLGAIR
jgi:hypothetical protein